MYDCDGPTRYHRYKRVIDTPGTSPQCSFYALLLQKRAMDTHAEVSLLHAEIAEIALPAEEDNIFKATKLLVSKKTLSTFN